MTFLELPAYILIAFISEWICVKEFLKMDTAVCNRKYRSDFRHLYSINVTLIDLFPTGPQLEIRISSNLRSMQWSKYALIVTESEAAQIEERLTTVLQNHTLHSVALFIKHSSSINKLLMPIARGLSSKFSGFLYYGQVKNGMRHGFGVQKFHSSFYAGEWRDDITYGGFAQLSNGCYRGDWSNKDCHSQNQDAFHCFKRHMTGYGTYQWKSGDSYVGEWMHGDMHGHGTCRWANGNVYEGYLRDHKMNGQGSLTKPCGEVYVGEWKDALMHGTGVIEYSDGTVYEGEFHKNKCDGRGLCRYASGEKFDGMWKNDERNGPGVMTYENGDTHQGEWADNLKEGIFVYKCCVTGETTAEEYSGGIKQDSIMPYYR